MRSGAVEVLVGIHGIRVDVDELDHWALDAPGATPLERHVANQRRYYDWIRGAGRFPIIERAFAWLEERWPAGEGDTVLSWGDSRLANVLWRDFDPVAVIDWEAVAIGPRELDLGWLVFHHEFFQRIAEGHGYLGVPDLLRREDVVALYTERSGHEPADLDWFLVYAELRQALTSIRVSSRAVHFGERAAPDDPQDLIFQRDHLQGVLDT
jgi:aminoglycoside phosphotransferase (APT) family kinase protein